MSADEPDDEQDPELLAQLQAWFGDPSGSPAVAESIAAQQDIDPELIGTSREPGIPDFLREARLEREATLAEVDMTLVSQLERNAEQLGAFVAAPAAPAAVLDPSIAKFDATSALDVVPLQVGRRTADKEVVEAMEHSTPQALLRDLHRLVRDTPWMRMDDLPLGVPKMSGPSKRVEEVMTTSYTVALSDEPSPRNYMAEDLADMNERIRAEDWGSLEFPKEESREWSSRETADAYLWFAGIDPATQK